MLRVSLKTEYALRALMELAARAADGFVPARAIATAQGIPLRTLEHQLAALHKAGIVESTRGAAGGAMLARDASAISVSEIIQLFEGSLAPMFCLEEHDEQCAQTQRCGLQHLWIRVENAVRSVLDTTTIADLTERHRVLQPLLWPVSIARNE